jgi:uncharacterized membrane protein YphA (DoxX/SURF4 family)
VDPLILTITIFLARVIMGLRLVFPGWMMAQGQLPKTSVFKPARTWLGWFLFVIGLALVFGIFVRLASVIGIIIVLWQWYRNFPNKEGIIDEWLVHAGLFGLLFMVNAGIWWGFDTLFLQIPFFLNVYQLNPWLQWVL